ncbi:response regulator transcription factor [Nocardioides sp. 31GB23]|uniref:response regulator transcription factor n=1 Tax=Nocardioides sp. 31GB23 TaxID=3156065 RepID=UPI0032AFBB9D
MTAPVQVPGRAPVRVLVADDQDMVRVGLSTILDAQPSIEVVGQARDGLEAVALVASLRPDVCLFDIRMPHLDGIEATRRVAGPDVADPVPVIVVTTFDQDEHVYDALRAGARGFLLKDADPELLARAVLAAAQGEALIAPAVTARLLAAFASSRAGAVREPVDPLTPREEAVLDLVAAGRTNAEVADELFLSLSTVKTHIGALMTKLSARNRVELVIWAYESGRADPGRRH